MNRRLLTFIYNPRTENYETDPAIPEEDTRPTWPGAREIFNQRLGMKPTVLTWPFGAYNEIGIQEARQLGFKVLLNLRSGFADVRRLDRVNRYYATPMLHWVPEFKEDLKRQFESKTPIRGRANGPG